MFQSPIAKLEKGSRPHMEHFLPTKQKKYLFSNRHDSTPSIVAPKNKEREFKNVLS